MKAPVQIGWYDYAGQREPTHDPDVYGTPCPVCGHQLSLTDIRTVCVMPLTRERSGFYRLHRTCAEVLPEAELRALDDEALNLLAKLPPRADA